MTTKGMEALQAQVVDRIIKARVKDRTTSKLIRMRPDFKYALMKAANRAGLSLESYIRVTLADKMEWEGEL